MKMGISFGCINRHGAAFFLVVGGRLLFTLCLLMAAVQAQYRFDNWTADNGLPQNSVRDIVQTGDGYLWLTTFDGLVRFDGARFTVFNKSNTSGIVTNRFTRLYEDGQGRLWAGTESGDALTWWQDGRFTTYTNANVLPQQTIWSLGGDGLGHLVVFGKEQVWRWVESDFQRADGLRLSVPQDNNAARDLAQHLAAGGEQQLSFWGAGQAHIISKDFRPIIVGDFMQDRQGRFWMGAETGLLRYEQGKMLPSGPPDGMLAGAPTMLINGWQPLQAVTFARDGSLWLTNTETGQSRLITAHPPEGLRGVANHGGDVFRAYGDREGNLWFGTAHYGIYRARPQSLTVYNAAQGVVLGETYPILADQHGMIWVGSHALFGLQSAVLTQYDSRAREKQPITSLYEDRRGQLWVNGAWRWSNGRLLRVLGEEVLPIPDTYVWTMHEDRAGVLWLGTSNGLVRYQQGVATRYTTKDGLAGDDTKVILADVRDPQTLWIGSYGGLTRYRDGQFTRWTEADGLPGNTVRTLKQDADGTLWIGTYDSGLGRFKDGRFTRYTVRDGLFDSGVFQILEDDFGWFWMGCNRGIYRVRKQELNDFADGKSQTITCFSYGKSDGMENVECNGGRWPAGAKTPDGKLWFPTMGGVVVVDPATIKTNPQPPSVVIETMRIHNEAVSVDAWQSALRNPNSAITIKPGQDSFEIEYTALSFINSDNLKFKYKLEGLDHDWVEAGTRRTAYFSHVPPGGYTFKVIAANSDGVWNEIGQSLRITVLPPFYRTWWFVLLTVVTLLGLATLAYQYRIRQLQKLQRAQQNFTRQLIASQEAERKRIAGELHDSLGQHLVVIKNLALLWLQRHSNDDAQQIADISATTSQAISEVKEISYNLRPYQMDRIGLTKAIEALVRKAEAASGIRFVVTIDDLRGVLPKEAEINFYRIVQEGVNNIIKHSQATEASIMIYCEEQRLYLTMRDNGKGFTPSATTSEAPGFGLLGINERAQLLGGQVVIHSAPQQGTTTTMEIPLRLGEEHDQ